MALCDLDEVMGYIEALYGETFPGLPTAMLDLWRGYLGEFATTKVLEAVEVWAVEHTYEPPNLGDLLATLHQWEEEREQDVGHEED